MKRSLICIALLCLSAAAQKTEKGKPAVPAVTGVSLGMPFVVMEDAARLHIRDLEYKANQLQIESQTMRVKIEENKAAEAEVWKQIQALASQYAKDKNIDVTDFDFDAVEAKFVKKKKP